MASGNSTAAPKAAAVSVPENSVAAPKAAAVNAPAKPAANSVPKASTYSIDEFAAASKTMGATPDVVRAALRTAGKTAYTKNDAKMIIEKYKKKEVKA